MDEDARKRLSEILERAMNNRSQRSLSADAGVGLNAVQRWLHGKSVPMLDKLPIIARSAGVSVGQAANYIFLGEEGLEEDGFKPTVAEDVVNYSNSLSDEETARLIGLLAQRLLKNKKTPSDTKVLVEDGDKHPV